MLLYGGGLLLTRKEGIPFPSLMRSDDRMNIIVRCVSYYYDLLQISRCAGAVIRGISYSSADVGMFSPYGVD